MSRVVAWLQKARFWLTHARCLQCNELTIPTWPRRPCIYCRKCLPEFWP